MKSLKTTEETLDDTERDGRSSRHDDRRRQLMDDAVAYVLREGLAGLSIRPMAEALGISHRTLLHHFGSKEQMVARVLNEIRRQQMEDLRLRALREAQDPLTMLDAGWAYASRPERLPFWRAFFEIYGIAAKNPAQYADFLDSVIKPWLDSAVRATIKAGVPQARAEALMTLTQAATRGLILDLLTTGDRRRVERAYALLRGIVQAELEALGAGKAQKKGAGKRQAAGR